MSKKKLNFGERLLQMLGVDPFTTNTDLNFQNLQSEYYTRLYGIAVGCVQWEGLPDEIDTTIMERMLNNTGCCIITYDDVLSKYIILTLGVVDKYDIYGRPENYEGVTLYGGIHYKNLNKTNSVIIWDNTNYISSIPAILHSASNMANIRMTMNSNLYAMRKPFMIKTTKENYASAKAVLDDYDNYKTGIFIDRTMDNETNFEVFDMKVQSFLRDLREEYAEEWNEALTKIGIPNIQGMKRERMITDEVDKLMGGAVAQQYVKLQPRLDACKLLSRYLGNEVSVSYREGFIENASQEEFENFENVSRETLEGGGNNE